MLDTKILRERARELGIEIRICPALSFPEESERIKFQVKQGLFIDPADWNDIDNFCNVQSIFPEAKSIISSCLFYLTSDEPDPSSPGNPYGLIARYTARNYYRELKLRLKKLGQFLKNNYGANFVAHSCGPLAEKPIAQHSGIGYYGKHSIIINPLYGSWIVLGEIITDLEFEPDESVKIECGECRQCIDACPTRAIIKPYIIDRRRCIQALTNWLGEIPEDIARVWGNRLYGCTTCQDVCPRNRWIKPEPPKTEIGVVGNYLPLIEILRMDEKTYRKKFVNNQISARWIHFEAIKRNALLALGNIRDRKTIPILKKFAKKDNQLLKKTAEWALKQF